MEIASCQLYMCGRKRKKVRLFEKMGDSKDVQSYHAYGTTPPRQMTVP
jgi:hypothetical protein